MHLVIWHPKRFKSYLHNESTAQSIGVFVWDNDLRVVISLSTTVAGLSSA